MVFGRDLTYTEIENIHEMKYIDASSVAYTLSPDINSISDIKLSLKSLFPDEVTVNVTIDVIRLKSKLTTNNPISFTKKTFYHTISGFTQSHSNQ